MNQLPSVRSADVQRCRAHGLASDRNRRCALCRQSQVRGTARRTVVWVAVTALLSLAGSALWLSAPAARRPSNIAAEERTETGQSRFAGFAGTAEQPVGSGAEPRYSQPQAMDPPDRPRVDDPADFELPAALRTNADSAERDARRAPTSPSELRLQRR
jgi:hypothetical protein